MECRGDRTRTCDILVPNQVRYQLRYAPNYFLFNDSLLDKDLLQSLDRTLHLLLCMCGHQSIAHECILRSTCGRDDRIDEHASLEGKSGNEERLISITHIERNDGTLGIADLKAFLTETLQSVVGHLPQTLDTLRLALDNMQGFEGCCSGSGRVRSREDIRSSVMAQEVDRIPVGGDETTDGCE